MGNVNSDNLSLLIECPCHIIPYLIKKREYVEKIVEEYIKIRDDFFSTNNINNFLGREHIGFNCCKRN